MEVPPGVVAAKFKGTVRINDHECITIKRRYVNQSVPPYFKKKMLRMNSHFLSYRAFTVSDFLSVGGKWPGTLADWGNRDFATVEGLPETFTIVCDMEVIAWIGNIHAISW